MIEIRFDEGLGIIRSTAVGYSTGDHLDDYITRYAQCRTKCMARHGRNLHLVDAREAALQSRDDAERLRGANESQLQPNDRTAILTTSTLAKLQAARIGPASQFAFFDKEEDAVGWLLYGEGVAKAG
jgi:hypothetical protein